MSKQKKKKSFPTAFTVLFIVLIFAAILTYIVPAGLYAKLAYDMNSKSFIVTKPDGSEESLPATQDTLEDLGIKVDLKNFEDESIDKPIAIPGTYERVEQNPQGLYDVIKSPIEGVYDSIDIILFIFIIGGCIGVLNNSGAFDAGIAHLSKVTKGKEYVLIVIITALIAFGGTTYGMAEETIAFYPILIPVFVAAGYDAIVCIAAVYMGSSIGTMFSTVNPFSAIIASNAAGINFSNGLGIRIIGLIIATTITITYILKYAKKVKKDPTQSIIYDQKEHIEKKFLQDYDENDVPEFTTRRKLMLILLVASFAILIWGVSSQDWWFTEMTALFLIIGILMGIISGMGEKAFVNEFIAGAADLTSVALIVGVARSINMVMENGLISDTILFSASNAVSGINPGLFVIFMLFIFIGLGFFIPSSSGLAVLSMPIMAPLADTVGVPREVVVSAYLFGQGLIAFITPTGLILATLEMVDVTYDKWLKFILPLMGYTAAFSILMLLIQVFI